MLHSCDSCIICSGEEVFDKVSEGYKWPRVPMKDSLIKLAPSVPMSFLYGNKSPFLQGGKLIKQHCAKNVHLDYQDLEATHHPQVEDPKTFNMKVNEICERVDANKDWL